MPIDYNLLHIAAIDVYSNPKALADMHLTKEAMSNIIVEYAGYAKNPKGVEMNPPEMLLAVCILRGSSYSKHPSWAATLKALVNMDGHTLAMGPAPETPPVFRAKNPAEEMDQLIKTRLIMSYRRMKAGSNGEEFMIEAQRYLSERFKRRVSPIEVLGHVFGVSSYVDGVASLHKELASLVKEMPGSFQEAVTDASERGEFRSFLVLEKTERMEKLEMRRIGK